MVKLEFFIYHVVCVDTLPKNAWGLKKRYVNTIKSLQCLQKMNMIGCSLWYVLIIYLCVSMVSCNQFGFFISVLFMNKNSRT